MKQKVIKMSCGHLEAVIIFYFVPFFFFFSFLTPVAARPLCEKLLNSACVIVRLNCVEVTAGFEILSSKATFKQKKGNEAQSTCVKNKY